MPPKSTPRKEKAPYFRDEATNFVIFNQNQDDFKGKGRFSYYDPVQCTFVPNKWESRLAFNVEEKLPSFYKRDLLFVNHHVMQLMDVTTTGRVIVEVLNVLNGNLIRTFSKRCWPIEDRALDTIKLVEEEFWRLQVDDDDNQTLNDDIKVTVRKIDFCKPALEMTLKTYDLQDLKLEQRQHVLTVLKKEIVDHAYHQRDQFRIKFFQHNIKFEIERLVGADTVVETSLTNAFNQLSLTTKFYLIDKKTSIDINSENAEYDHFLSRPIFVSGLEQQENEILDIIYTAKSRSNYNPLTSTLTKGILIHGGSGCGKTVLVQSILKKANVRYFEINTGQLFSRYYGETETNLSAVFAKARAFHPVFSIILIEDIQNLCPKGDNTDIIRRITSAFIDQLDRLSTINSLVIATTNQIDELNSAIRRSGRLDYEIEIAVPNPRTRSSIIKVLLEKHNIDSSFTETDIHELATVSHGFTGADLESLITKTFYTARNLGRITLNEILKNLSAIRPSAMREVQIESPNIYWSDIGGQKDLKLKLQQAIEWPIKHPETFQRLGITPPRGLLMFGPPGCSKTMIAKALATESGVNFLSIKGSELFSMWVGESEKAVRKLFQKAREVAPAIIFFDELDAIGGERSGQIGSGSSVKERVLAQILTEIDGVHTLKDVTIIAATNRPDLIDKALMRPGRLDRIIFVGLPDSATRREILNIKLSKMAVSPEVLIDELVEFTEGYSGAEVEALCKEAALHALERSVNVEFVEKEDFLFATSFVQPRTSLEQLKFYEDYLKKNIS